MLTPLVSLSPGISTGLLAFMSVRGGDHQYFFICSRALDDVIEAQSHSAAHQVMLSQTCWELCERRRIWAMPLPGKRVVKVGGWGGLEPFGRPPPEWGDGGAAERLNVARAVSVSVGREPKPLALRLS